MAENEVTSQENEYSDTASATSHRSKNDTMAEFGFVLKKVYFNEYDINKLDDISHNLYGKSLYNEKQNKKINNKKPQAKEINVTLLTQLLSLCINKCYRLESIMSKEIRSQKILASPKTENGLELRQYHQMATFLGNKTENDLMAIAEKFNEFKSRFPYTKLLNDYINFYYPEDENQLETEWLPRNIQAILNRKKINEYIKLLNERAEW